MTREPFSKHFGNAIRFAAAIATGVVLSPSHAQVRIIATEDALINSTNSVNYTGIFSNVLASETGPSNGYWGSWIKFDISSLLGAGASIAYLDLQTHLNHSLTAIEHEVFYSTNDSWFESSITGLNQPSEVTLTSVGAVLIPSMNSTFSWNVTSALNSVASQDGILSFLVRPKTYPVQVSRGPHFDSTEFGSAPPALRVSPVPEPASAIQMIFGFLFLASAKRLCRKVGHTVLRPRA